MSESILFSPSVADALNVAAKKIAPHLFVFCHYNPAPLSPPNSDGKFLLGVLNLYKLAVDASLAKGVRDITWKYDRLLSQRLGDIIHHAEFLREALAHNYSLGDGSTRPLWLYNRWVKAVTGQNKLTTPSDYGKALAAIDILGQDLADCLGKFLSQVAKIKSSDRADLIGEWEGKIIKFYFSGERGRNIIQQQLREFIHAKLVDNGVDNAQINGLYRSNSQIALWVQKFYLNEFDSKLRGLEKLKKMRLSSKTLASIEIKYQDINDDKETKQKEIAASKKKRIGQLNSYDYLDYYLQEARGRMEKALQNSDKIDTLLPTGFLAGMVASDMGKVSAV